MKNTHENKSFLILLLGLLAALSTLTIAMYIPGFHQMASDFKVGESQIAFTLTSYFIGITLGQLIYGPIIDQYGRRNPLLISLSIFILSSIGCSLANSLNIMILLRFIQALSLLEFLAHPDEYKKFEEVKKVIARHIAKDTREYQKLLERFFELTGKKDSATNKVIGYRTRVIHMGENIESIVPDKNDRKLLFVELQTYIKAVIDHMISHSHLAWQEYLIVRDGLRPFEN